MQGWPILDFVKGRDDSVHSDGGSRPFPICRGFRLVLTFAVCASVCLPPVSDRPSAQDASRYAAAILGTAGLQAYYRLGEASGATARDSRGARNGTIQGNVTLGVPGLLAGDADTAARFDGATGFVSVSNGSALLAGGPMTIELFAVIPERPTQNGLIAGIRNQMSADFYVLALADGNQLECRFRNSAGQEFQIKPTVTPGMRHQIVLTYDGSATLTLYLDGVNVASAPANGTITVMTEDFRIGSDPQGNAFAGVIDEVAVYNVALSATQVSSHFALAGSVVAAPSVVVTVAPTQTRAASAVPATPTTAPVVTATPAAASVTATINPFVRTLPTQASATGPGGIIYPPYTPRRLRDG